MSSSTSSSSRVVRWRVPLALLVIFGALELITRTWLFDSSKDFRRFAGYPQGARALAAGDGVRVALVGNSATARGVDLPTLRTAISGAGVRASLDMFVADQSRINTWQFMIQRYFLQSGAKPDWLVVTYYEDDLEDGNNVEIGRLAQFFTSMRDWPSVFAVDLPQWSQRAEFVLASGWATFAASERIRERALEAMIPDYKEYVSASNAAIYEHNHRRAQAAPPAKARSYQALRRLLRTVTDSGIKLVVVAFPTRIDSGRMPYDVADETVQVLREGGASFLDLRRVPGLEGADQYDDEVHLSVAGRVPYSRALGAALAPLLAQDRSAR